MDQEESYWLNRCHEQRLLKYFHNLANGRKRKSTVLFLESDGVVIEGDDNLLKHATNYYSDLFGSTDEHNIHISHFVGRVRAGLR